MQTASQAYKSQMKGGLRNQTYIRVTLGLINQEAQAKAYIPNTENYTYYSNLKRPLDNYQVQELYATCDQNYTAVDGSMYFLPRNREEVVLNAGIVSEEVLGAIEIRFPIVYDIKGLTVEFGKSYPVNFTIESDNSTVKITNNTQEHFVTEEIFMAATFLRFKPSRMVNGQSRFRIQMLTMGIGIYFDNRNILSATKKEHISSIMEELPAIDFELTVNNKDRAFDIENEESVVNFLEVGQTVEVLYGQELDDGTVEWLPGAALQLREWSADDEEMNFTATDRFDSMDGTYYKGMYRADGISLYDLAVDVFQDARIDGRIYWIDHYLKNVVVCNPIPVVTHREALQLIANAGRCILYQGREGSIFLKSSFVPDMTASSANGTYYSHTDRVLDKTPKDSYALTNRYYTDVIPTQYFLPRQEDGVTYLNTGYISEAVSGADGTFFVNPTVEVVMEAAYKCFGITLEFGRNAPESMVLHSYREGKLQEDFSVEGLTDITVINHEFPEIDHLVIEFTRHKVHVDNDPYIYLMDIDGFYLTDGDGTFLVVSPKSAVKGRELDVDASGNRVVLDNIIFGDSTDYVLEYGHELTKTPKGTQLPKVRELQVIRTMYGTDTEVKELAKELIFLPTMDGQYTFYLSNASYGYTCVITDAQAGQTATIVESSAYYVTVEFSGIKGPVEVSVLGREYKINQSRVSRSLNAIGTLETWENPLVSDLVHAAELADWVGDYLRSDREYDLSYRGEPRIDANDIMFLENKYVPDLLIRASEHTLKFNGALSGTIKARRDMSYVAATKNRLASR